MSEEKQLEDVATATTKPNDVLVKQLEELLEQAKAGELQGAAFATCWAGEGITHGWILPPGKNWHQLMLAEICVMQHNFTVNYEIRGCGEHSVLARNLMAVTGDPLHD